MLRPITTNQFEKDIKLSKKRGKDLAKIFKVMRLLLNEEQLPLKNRDHALTGSYTNRRECHIEPDWLLIYKQPQFGVLMCYKRRQINDYLVKIK